MWPFSRRTSIAVSSSPSAALWPPAEHEERLARYERYRKLYMGQHFAVFSDPLRGADHDQFPQYYITVNLAAQVSHTASDLLFGEPPQFIAEDGARQGLIDQLVEQNHLITQLQRAARGQSYRGDTVFKLWWDASPPSPGRVAIAPLPPDMYFPVFNADDPAKVESVWVAWLRDDVPSWDSRPRLSQAMREGSILRVELHMPGGIRNLVFPYKNGRIGDPLPLASVDPGLPEFVATGIDEIPLVHIPNLQTDDSGPFGISDYAFFEAIQREVNNRLSQIGTVLDKHADPNMVIPAQALDVSGAFHTVTQKAWPVDPNDVRPEYVTWDGKLESAFAELEFLKEFFFMASSVSPGTLGISRGGYEESGLAIRLRQLRTLKWIENKRASWTLGLQRVFTLAQKLWLVHGRPGDEEAGDRPLTRVQILWRDGLPTDRSADIEDAVKAVQGGVMSLRRGIQLAQGLEGENLEAEAGEIQGLMTRAQSA